MDYGTFNSWLIDGNNLFHLGLIVIHSH